MKVSVVVPTYCRPNDLTRLFKSLQWQTIKPAEILIIDDSPTAVIGQLCKDYAAAFREVGVTLVYTKNPRERSSAIAKNVGAEEAKGDLIIFLDSDVVLFSDFIEKILETFEKHPDALAVGGWTVFPTATLVQCKGIRYYFGEVLKKLFFLHHHAEDSCKYPEYPIALMKTINSNWLSSVCIAVKRSVLDEFRWDENLREYAYMEDVLFSRSIFKRYPKSLFMTPHAKCIHKVSKEGRTDSSKLRRRKRQNRKYVMMKLLGSRGLLLYGWQVLGLLIFSLIRRLRRWEGPVDEPSSMRSDEYEMLFQKASAQTQIRS